MTEQLDIITRAQLVHAIQLRYDERKAEVAEAWLDEALRKLKAGKKRVTKAAIYRLIDVMDSERTFACEMAFAASC